MTRDGKIWGMVAIADHIGRSPTWVKKWKARLDIPIVKIGGHWCGRVTDLDRWKENWFDFVDGGARD